MLASGGLTSQTDMWGPHVSDWVSPVSKADQSTGQRSAMGPHVSDTAGATGEPRGCHVGATSRRPPATSGGDGVSPELRSGVEGEHGLHRATRCPAARRMVAVAPPETAGVAAGDVPRRRWLRAVVVATILCTGRSTRARVRPRGTRGVRWTRTACQTHSQATGASFTAAASHGSNGGDGHGGRRRAGAFGGGGGAHREAHGGRWEA